MSIKSINEGFEKQFCEKPLKEEKSKHFDLLMALKRAREALQRNGNNNLKAYEVAYQNVIEDYFPDKLWWEVTDCNIFDDLFNNRDPEHTEIEIVKGIKDGVDECLTEAVERGFKFERLGKEWEVLDTNGEYTLIHNLSKDLASHDAPYVVTKLHKDKDGYSWEYGYYFRSWDNAEMCLEGIYDDPLYREKDESLKEARNPEHEVENERIHKLLRGDRYSRSAKEFAKDVKELGYDVDHTGSKRFEYTISNPETGRSIKRYEVPGRYSGLRGVGTYTEPRIKAGEHTLDGRHINAKEDEFDYKGYLDKPIRKSERDDRTELQKFKDDKDFIDANWATIEKGKRAQERINRTRERIDKYKQSKEPIKESVTVTQEIDLDDFDFWGPAEEIVRLMTDDEKQMAQEYIEETYPNGIGKTELNDIFAYDEQFICGICNLEDIDELYDRRKNEDLNRCEDCKDDLDEQQEIDVNNAISTVGDVAQAVTAAAPIVGALLL